MSTFGWCLTNQHSECRGSYKHWWWEKRGKRGKEIIVYGDNVNCGCPCHTGKKLIKKNMPKPKRRRKK